MNALSIDVEEWFHLCRSERFVPASSWGRLESRVEAGTRAVLRILAEHNVRATFFILGYVAERHPNLVREIARAGHEIGTHGYWHRRLDDQSPEEFEEDLRSSIELLTAISGREIRCYRAPEWSMSRSTSWAYEILARNGIRYDSSVLPLKREEERLPGSIPTGHGVVREFPLSTRSLRVVNIPFSNGTAVRLLPLSAIAASIRRSNRAGIPVNLSLHSWDGDAGFPHIVLPLVRGFLHYLNRNTAHRKLRALLATFPFGTIATAVNRFLESPPPRGSSGRPFDNGRRGRRSCDGKPDPSPLLPTGSPCGR
ncbi:MAG: hypothetical protein A2Z34_00885 [Planctomycetes bacterium RBG_16_59_8]|nr:MAG: hypothetical protein A2Z34_00885 [Planctomycetes bacterium RBG_16_59_8]